MATFKPDYKVGDGYAPVCMALINDSRVPLLYDLRGVVDAHGDPMRDYGHQTSLLSTYQKARESHMPSVIRGGAAAFSTSFAAMVFKLAFHTTVGTFKRLRASGSRGQTDLVAPITNLRVGALPPGGALYVEMGSIPVDGRLKNKGWVSNRDSVNFTGSVLGPTPLAGDALDQALEAGDTGLLEQVRRACAGLHFWGERTGFWDSVVRRDMFNANINFRAIPGATPMVEREDTAAVHEVAVGSLIYRLDGGGFSPASLDYIQIRVRNA